MSYLQIIVNNMASMIDIIVLVERRLNFLKCLQFILGYRICIFNSHIKKIVNRNYSHIK